MFSAYRVQARFTLVVVAIHETSSSMTVEISKAQFTGVVLRPQGSFASKHLLWCFVLQAAQPTSSEAMFDQRLFNQSAGMVTTSARCSCSFSSAFRATEEDSQSQDPRKSEINMCRTVDSQGATTRKSPFMISPSSQTEALGLETTADELG